MSCIIPANQPIYQILLNKSASYITDDPLNVKMYNEAAEKVKDCNFSIPDNLGSVWTLGLVHELIVTAYIELNPPTPQ